MVQDPAGLSHRQVFTVLQIIWGAMVFSIGIYGVVLWMVPDLPGGMERPGGPAAVLGVVSAGLFILQARLYRNLTDEKLFPRILDLGSWGLRPEAAARLQELKVPERGLQLIAQAHMVFGVLIWALAEAVAVFGLFLSLVSGDLRFMGGFGLASILMMLRFRPRRDAFEEQIRRWQRYVETKRGGV